MESRFRDNALTAFQQHIDAEGSVHAKLYQSVIARLKSGKNAAFTLPADAVLPPLRHALESRRPRARYPVTIPAKVLPFLKRIMSDQAMDWVARKSGDQPGK